MTNIYIFDFGNRIKIGQSKNVQARLKQIENSSGEKAINQFSLEADQEIEKAIHLFLRKYRTVGEYFNCSFDVAKKALLDIVEKQNRLILFKSSYFKQKDLFKMSRLFAKMMQNKNYNTLTFRVLFYLLGRIDFNNRIMTIKQVNIARELGVKQPHISTSLKILQADGIIEKRENDYFFTEKFIRYASDGKNKLSVE
jgi:DNA-binding MarR family transcriptional regulator